MTEVNLLASLNIQVRVIKALILREMITRFGRHNIGVLWLVFEPMLFTLGVAGLWTIAKMHTISSIPIIAFAITGYSSVLLWRNVASRCSKAIEPNLSLMYHRNVKVIDIFLARIILEWVGATSSLFVLTLVFAIIKIMEWPYDYFTLLLGWLLLAWFSLALGLIVGVISEQSETFERVWHIFTYLLFPLSGAGFMVEWLPKNFQEMVLWLPMVHGAEMIRHGYFGNVVKTHESVFYFIYVNIVLTYIGLYSVAYISRKVQPE